MIRVTIVSLAALTWLLPLPVVRASHPAGGREAAAVVDVRLDERGSVRGILIDAAGQPLATRSVVLQQTGAAVCSTETDAAGGFAFRGLAGGVYRLIVGDQTVTCRVWTHGAAPPTATDQLTVVAGPPLIRGQQPFSEIFRNPLFVGLIIAAAIAIPIAVHNAQDDQPSGS
jgi:hypothetical protein